MSTQLKIFEFHEIYNKTYQSILKFIAVKCQNVEDINDILQDTYTELYKILNKRNTIEVESEVAFIIGIAKKVLKRYFSFKYKYQLLSYSLNTDKLAIDVQDKFDLEQDIITKNNVEEIWNYLTSGGQYIEDSFIDIEFSKNEILHCLYFDMEEVEESIINNVPVKIFAYEENQGKSKISGYASFKYNDYNFDIDVNMITLEDFIKVIRSIIK